MADEEKCQRSNCDQPARAALRTQRPKRDMLYSTLYYDERTAPKKAKRLCKEHAVATITELSLTLIDEG